MQSHIIFFLYCRYPTDDFRDQPVIHPQENVGYDPDVEECLSLLSSNVHPSGSSVVENI